MERGNGGFNGLFQGLVVRSETETQGGSEEVEWAKALA